MAGDYWNPLPYVPNYTFTWSDPRVDDLLKRVAELEAAVARLEGGDEPTTCIKNDDGSLTFLRDGAEFTLPAHEVEILKESLR